VGPLKGIAALALALAAAGAAACEVPGDGTSKHSTVHYVLTLSAPIVRDGLCYWPIEARAGDRLWTRFYSTPRGEQVLVEQAGGALTPLDEWRKRAP